jgi:formylglycine-generating enzyme required for sulfatase activity
MLGNVWEWVADWYGDKYYAGSEARDPQGPPEGTARVLRGGSWYSDPWILRASDRVRLGPGVRDDDLGCRCMREVIP